MKLGFEVLGKPKGKGRPRFSRRGKFVTAYTPKGTKKYEDLVRESAIYWCGKQLNKDYKGKVNVKISAFFEPPKSISQKKYGELIGTPYLHKPDADNIAKIICDALNGIAYKDDNQIYHLEVEKIYNYENKVIVLMEYED